MKATGQKTALLRLRLGIGLFVAAVAVPSLLLVLKAYDQMKWESFRQQQLVAEGLAERIGESLAALVRTEDARPVEDYDFLLRSGDTATPYTRRSPLAEMPSVSAIPGLIGWFEVAANGDFSSPLLPESGVSPADYGVDAAELALRQAQAQRVRAVLVGNRLVERGSRESDKGATAAALEPAIAAAAGSPRPARSDPRPQAEPPAAALGMSGEGLAKAPVPAPAESKTEESRLSQAAFERLAAEDAAPSSKMARARQPGRAAELKLDEALASRGQRKAMDELAKDAPAKLEKPTPASPAALSAGRLAQKQTQTAASRPGAAVRLFGNAIEPCEVGLLDSGHLLLFRSVWVDGERIIQGALIEQTPFLEAMVGGPLADTVLSHTTHLTLAYRDTLVASFRARPKRDYEARSRTLSPSEPPLSGALLYRTRMPEPFGGLELIFSVSHLPVPPGAAAVGWMAGALALVLLAGGWSMYRLGLRQLALIRQQQDFVSAVSHELKTPLTSIRMYAEMLRAGFATEERKGTYYRFIHEESERLSRLIANVLQLARIGRGALVLEPRAMALCELMAAARERIASQAERAGFQLDLSCEDETQVMADPDAFVQILINLVDNALKFAAKSEPRRIEIRCERATGERMRISVRDFGPGIPKALRQRVFELFYRGPAAQSDAISGTGIGLALVWRLTDAMHGRVEVVDRAPGAELRVELPIARATRLRRPRADR